jgi:hypothetical protein
MNHLLRGALMLWLAVCLFVCMAVPATAAEAPATARLLAVDNESWQSDLLASNAAADTTFRFPSYLFGDSPIDLPEHGATIVRGFGLGDPSADAVRIIPVEITAGALELQTQATYFDTNGAFNTVTIPALGEQLPAGSGAAAYLEFDRIESTGERATWFALLSDTPAFVSLYVYDGQGKQVEVEEVYLADRFTFYEMTTSIDVGRVFLKRGSRVGCGGCESQGAPIDAVAFVGYRHGGGPRVEMPTLGPAGP